MNRWYVYLCLSDSNNIHRSFGEDDGTWERDRFLSPTRPKSDGIRMVRATPSLFRGDLDGQQRRALSGSKRHIIQLTLNHLVIMNT